MKAEQILAGKGGDVFAVRDNQTIADAVAVLNEKNVGAIIVRGASEDVVGILSERDIVRRLGREGAGVLSLSVRDCMTPDPITCSPEATVDEMMELMSARRIRHLPVATGNALIGVVSIGDVVKRKIEQAEQEAQALKEYISG